MDNGCLMARGYFMVGRGCFMDNVFLWGEICLWTVVVLWSVVVWWSVVG